MPRDGGKVSRGGGTGAQCERVGRKQSGEQNNEKRAMFIF